MRIDSLLHKKIIVGTAQLGNAYSISQKKKMCKLDFCKILDILGQNKLIKIDTAQNYGEAEKILGNLKNFKIEVTTKIKINNIYNKKSLSSEINDLINSSILKLNCKKLNVLIHDWDRKKGFDYKSTTDYLITLKKEKKINKVGVSIYDNKDLINVLKNFPKLDIIQLPFNVLNQDEFDNQLLTDLNKSGKIIQARSIFLQGLLLNSNIKLPKNINNLNLFLEDWFRFNNQNKLREIDSALGYVLNKEFISDVVIGFENLIQFKEILKYKHLDFSSYPVFSDIDPNDIDPRNW